jgi:hypothetical protein
MQLATFSMWSVNSLYTLLFSSMSGRLAVRIAISCSPHVLTPEQLGLDLFIRARRNPGAEMSIDLRVRISHRQQVLSSCHAIQMQLQIGAYLACSAQNSTALVLIVRLTH